MKKIVALFLVFSLVSCAELNTVINNLPGDVGISDAMIADGLKQALEFGIDKEVTKLTQENGFYRNELVKILLPEELQRVDKTLRDIGLDNLADEGLKLLNRAAEDAVSEATPIFIDAVKGITFADARKILLGNDRSATTYLENRTTTALYAKFNPVIKSSFQKVGADAIWEQLITRYNQIPFVNKVNPDLTDYVTNEALDGVFTMIAVEEKDIRDNIAARTTNLLQRVFALQD